MSGCDEDVGHPRGKLGQYDDDDDYEKDVEHPRPKMMVIVMNMWASQGEVGQGSSQGCHILRYNYLPYLGRFPCLDVTTRM